MKSIKCGLAPFLLYKTSRDKGNRVNILIADDDRNFCTVLKKELEEEKHTVDVVTDGVEAVLRFINNIYDFVLLDLRMPRLNGIDALRIIKNINPLVPAITFSGNAGSEEIEESVKCGAGKCLKKPFGIAKLKEEIKNYG
jgi:two-component system response regulator AtoC